LLRLFISESLRLCTRQGHLFAFEVSQIGLHRQ
jgi:hypothetical protein